MSLRLVDRQSLDDRIQMAPLGAQRHRRADPLVERHAADRVLLPQQQIGQADGDRRGVFELVQRAGAVAHAVRHVDQQRGPQVRVFLELLDVIAILLGPDFPIDVPQVVADGVFAVLAKFDRLAEIRAAVQSGQKAFDDMPRPQIKPRDAA